MTSPAPLTQTAPEPAVPPCAVQPLAARLDVILAALMLFVTARLRTFAEHTMPLCTRIGRARQRLARLLALLAAGRLPRQRAPRPGRKGGPRGPSLFRRRAWLFHALRDDPLRHNAAAHAAQLDTLLNEPSTQALLAAAPPAVLKSLGRTLRPLCRLLGITVPAPLQGPPPPPRPPQAAPPRPPRPTLPPLLPLYPQRRPRDMPFLRVPALKIGSA